MSGATTNQPRSFSAYLPYAAILVLIAAVRILDLGTADSRWRGKIYWSDTWLVSLSLVALVLCPLFAYATSRHFTRVTTALLCALFGCAITLFSSPLAGAVIGLVTGTLWASPQARRITSIALGSFGVGVLPGMITGLSLGFLGGYTEYVRVYPPHENAMIYRIVIALGFLAICWGCFYVWLRNRGERTANDRFLLSGVFFSLMFLVLAISFFACGIELDTRRRIGALSTNVYAFQNGRSQVAASSLLRGFTQPNDIFVNHGISAADAQLLRTFRIWDVQIDERGKGRFQADGFALLNLRDARIIHGKSPSFNDQSLRSFASSSMLQHLDLEGTQVTDDGLPVLRGMPMLSVLRLNGTQIRGTGLEHINRGAKLALVDLSNTRVDDQALVHLAGLEIEYLSLANTRVVGSGLQHVRGVKRIDLTNTSLEGRFLAQFADTQLDRLYLSGAALTTKDIETVSSFSKLRQLRITNTTLPAGTFDALQSANLSELQIEAAGLDKNSCPAIQHIADIELHYDASQMSLSEIVSDFEELRERLLALKGARDAVDAKPQRGPITNSPGVSLAIRNLEVRRELVRQLYMLEPCTLVNPQIIQPDTAVPVGHQEIDVFELGRYYLDL